MTDRPLNMLSPQHEALYALYCNALEGCGAPSMIAGPLPPNPTPHLDTIYERGAGTADPTDAFITRYRRELEGKVDRPLPIISVVGNTAIVSSLIRENYPSSMHHFADEALIDQNLADNSSSGMFSFIVLGHEGGKTDYQAACTAYVTRPKVAGRTANVLFVDDLAVSQAGKKSQLGVLAFREVLTRAAAAGQDTIEFRTRHRTSYKGFRGPVMAKILGSMGYQSTDHGITDQHSYGKTAEYMHLIEVNRLS